MKINPAPLHTAQALITSLIAALSISALGTSAHTLSVFNNQHTTNPWWLPLWPQHFDVHGTKALVGASTTTFILSMLFLVAVLIPRFNLTHRHTLRALVSLGTTLPSILVTLVTIVYVHILNGDSPERDTIQTWTCKYKNSQPLEQDIVLPSNMGNEEFGKLCRESRFALYGTLTVLLLLCISMALTVVTWLADKWAARSERKEVEMSVSQS